MAYRTDLIAPGQAYSPETRGIEAAPPWTGPVDLQTLTPAPDATDGGTPPPWTGPVDLQTLTPAPDATDGGTPPPWGGPVDLQSLVPAPDADGLSWWDRVKGQGEAGFRDFEQGATMIGAALGAFDAEQAADRVAQIERDNRNAPSFADLEEFQNKRGFWESAGFILSNPLDVAAPMIARSLASQAAPTAALAGAGALAGSAAPVVGTAAGALAGTAAGAGVGDAITSFNEFLRGKGYDLSDASQVRAALANKDVLAEAGKFAGVRGLIVGLAAGAGNVAGSAIGRVAAPTVAGQLTRNAAGTAAQMATDMAGETAAQLATTGEVNLRDVAAEGFMESPVHFAEQLAMAKEAPRAAAKEAAKAGQGATDGPGKAGIRGVKLGGDAPQNAAGSTAAAPAGPQDETRFAPKPEQPAQPPRAEAKPTVSRADARFALYDKYGWPLSVLDAMGDADLFAALDDGRMFVAAQPARTAEDAGEAAPEPAPAPAEKSPEQIEAERMEAEYRAEMEAVARGDDGGETIGFAEALERVGGLPSRKSRHRGEWSGELDMLEEARRGYRKGSRDGRAFAGLFQDAAPSMDEVAEGLRQYGFETWTADEVFALADEMLRSGKVPRAARRNVEESSPLVEMPFSAGKSADGRETLGAEALQAHIDARLAKAGIVPGTVKVVQSHEDVQMAAADRERAKKINAAGAYVRKTGEVYVFADHVEDLRAGVRVAIHELVGHRGIADTLGADFAATMARLGAKIPEAKLQRIAGERGLDLADTKGRREAVEEYLAHRAEPGLAREFLDAVKDYIERIGLYRFSDAEVREIIRNSRRYLSQNPSDPVVSPTGFIDWAVFTKWDEKQSNGKIKALPIRVLSGEHHAANKGYGRKHIVAEHGHEIAGDIDRFIHQILIGFNGVYAQPNGRLALIANKPARVAVVELRENPQGFYSVVTAHPKENPNWIPAGVRILGGRRAAFAQSESAPGRTAQELSSPKLPLEPLPGKDSWEYLRHISKNVNPDESGEQGDILFSNGIPDPAEADTPEKRRKFVESVKANPAINRDVADSIESFYRPITNKATVEEANAAIDRDGIEAAVARVLQTGRDGAPAPEALDYTIGIELMARLGAAGRNDEAVAVATHIAEQATKQGQAIQALSLLARLTPEGIRIYAARAMRQAAEVSPEAAGRMADADHLQDEHRKQRGRDATDAILELQDFLAALKLDPAKLSELRMRVRDALVGNYNAPGTARDKIVGLLVAQGMDRQKAIKLATRAVEAFGRKAKRTRDRLLKDLLKLPEQARPRIGKGLLAKWIALNDSWALTDEKLHGEIARRFGLPFMDSATAARIGRLQAEYERAANPVVKLVKGARMLDEIHSMIPASFWEKVNAVRNMAMLLNPKTIGRNLVGNALLWAGNIGADFVSAGVDRLVQVATGGRTYPAAGAAAERLKGLAAPAADFASGFGEARAEGLSLKESAAEGMRTMIGMARLTASGKLELQKITRSYRHVFSGRFGRLMEDATALALSAPDRAFHQSAYRAALARAMETRGEAVASADSVAEAMAEAQKAIYQDKNIVSKTLTEIKRALNLGKPFGLGSMVLPFTQVPGSILVRGAEWSPFGFINALYQTMRPALFRIDPRMGGRFNQKAFVDAFSRAALGTTGLMLTGAWLYRLGVISAAPDDDRDLEALRRAAGLGGFRINASELKRRMMSGNWHSPARMEEAVQDGDAVVSYDWAQPLSIGLAMGAQWAADEKAAAADLARGKEARLPANIMLLRMAAAGSRTLEEQPLLSGLQKAAGDLRNYGPVEAAWRQLHGLPYSFVPTVAGQVAQLRNDRVPETRGGQPGSSELQRALAKIPGLDDRFPPRWDAFGQAQERYGYGKNTLFNVMLNPAFSKEVKVNPVLREMERVYAATGNGQVFPNRTPVSVKIGEANVRLSNGQVSDYARFAGVLTQGVMVRLIAAPNWARLPDGEKAKMMASLLEDIGEATKQEVLGKPVAARLPDGSIRIDRRAVGLRLFGRALLAGSGK